MPGDAPNNYSLVMPGLAPGIHVLAQVKQVDVDGRDKPGHGSGLGPGHNPAAKI